MCRVQLLNWVIQNTPTVTANSISYRIKNLQQKTEFKEVADTGSSFPRLTEKRQPDAVMCVYQSF
jgi:hypothetical protein